MEISQTALRAEIEHWKLIVTREEGDFGTWNSPLCTRYWSKHNCRGCPVSTKTGVIDCDDTPYEKLVEHMQKEHKEDWAKDQPTILQCNKCEELAVKHLNFLKKLSKQ